MCGGGDDRQVVQPGANPPDFQLGPEEQELLQLQAEQMRTMMPILQGYAQNIAPLEQQRMIDLNQFISPILQGKGLGGIFDVLGTDYGSGFEQQLFDRSMGRTNAQLNSSGLMNSGVRAELANQTSDNIAMQSAGNRRSELSQMINLAMGVPLTAMPMAQTAAQSSQQAITGMGDARRNYELQAAQMGRPTYNYGGGGGTSMAGVGGALGLGLGALLAAPTGGLSLLAGGALGGGIGGGLGSAIRF